MLNLTAQDRCDGCGARAWHRATKPGSELLLCNHCHNEHKDKMLEQYWLIESDAMQTEPVAAAALH